MRRPLQESIAECVSWVVEMLLTVVEMLLTLAVRPLTAAASSVELAVGLTYCWPGRFGGTGGGEGVTMEKSVAHVRPEGTVARP